MTTVEPIRLTEAARRQIQAILQEKRIPDFYGLRVGLRGAGCGAEYLLGFDVAGETDETYRVDEVQIFIDRRHLMYVLGLEIDFEAGEEGAGFTFHRE